MDTPAQDQFRTLGEMFLRSAQRVNKSDAFLVKTRGQYGGISSAEVLLKTATLARSFEERGVAAGDCIAILAENRIEWALTDYAVLALGGVTVPLYATLQETDVEYILRDSCAKGVVVSTAEQLRKMLAVRANCPELRLIVVMDSSEQVVEGVEHWSDLADTSKCGGLDAAKSLESRVRAVQPGSPATIVYTSGTTGVFKGVVLSHANILSNIDACRQLFNHGIEDVGMSLLPLAHIFERMLDFYYYSRGVSIAYPENYNTLGENLREVRPTVMAVVPRVVEKTREQIIDGVRKLPRSKQKLFSWALDTGRRYLPHRLGSSKASTGLSINQRLADRLIFSKIRNQLGGRFTMLISGAAPLSIDLAEFFFSIGIPVYEGYGLTETSPVIAVNYPGAVKLGTVGRVIPGVEVRLGSETADEEGRSGREILVRGPNVAKSYRHPEDNQDAFDADWFRTGDLGILDERGFLTITGRKKNLFKTSGGKYISPEKLENLFQGHRYVAQLLVLGQSRKFAGALVVPNFPALEAYAREHGLHCQSRDELVARPEICAFMQRQLDERCRELAPYERIRQMVLLANEFTIASGELSATLKIRRRVVEERYREKIEEMFSRQAPEQEASVGAVSGNPRSSPTL